MALMTPTAPAPGPSVPVARVAAKRPLEEPTAGEAVAPTDAKRLKPDHSAVAEPSAAAAPCPSPPPPAAAGTTAAKFPTNTMSTASGFGGGAGPSTITEEQMPATAITAAAPPEVFTLQPTDTPEVARATEGESGEAGASTQATPAGGTKESAAPITHAGMDADDDDGDDGDFGIVDEAPDSD